jgi:phospholipase/lecithinase/hemolysin
MRKLSFRALTRGVFALGVLASASSAAVASYSQVVFFGDSLSDTGNLYAASGVPASPPYYNGQFSNGPVWTQNLANLLGLSANPSLAGGTNYAWAGATVIDYGRSMPVLPLQLQTYLGSTGGIADSGALYVILGGGNDINDASLNPATAAGNIIAAAKSVDGMVDTLYAAGARNILVGNLPNVGRTPLAASLGPAGAAGATALSQLFNGTLQTLLNASEAKDTGLDLDRLDLYGLLETVTANPAAYGFDNVTDACKSGPSGLPGTVCASPDSHLFWDDFHPSAAGHRLIAAAALSEVPEPSVLALALVALLLLGVSRRGRQRALQSA